MPEAAEEEEEDDEDDVMDEAEEARQRALHARTSTGKRASLIADKPERAQDWKPPVHPKTPEQTARIRDACLKSFMFSSLPESNLQQLLDAFLGPNVVPGGSEVIRQGKLVESSDPGLFVLERGKLDVYKESAHTPHPGTKVFTYDKMGQSFGELALLYNAPRAATVYTLTESVLWSIDRDTFNFCVKQGYQMMRERHVKFIDSVSILKDLTREEKEKLVDVLQSRTYQIGDTIIREGDAGDNFFFVEMGRARALKGGSAVMEYGPGDYFGELALLNRQPRAADVVATASPTTLVALDADSFDRLLGSLKTLMLQRANKDYGEADAKDGSAPVTSEQRKDVGFFGGLLSAWCQCSKMEVKSERRQFV